MVPPAPIRSCSVLLNLLSKRDQTLSLSLPVSLVTVGVDLSIIERTCLPIPNRSYSLDVLHTVAMLGSEGGVRFTRLGDALYISKPALSNTLKDLVEEGFLEKGNHGLYGVTTKGEEFLQRIRKEDAYTAEILRLSMERLQAQKNVGPMVAAIERRLEADPELRIPAHMREKVREYISLKIQELVTSIYRDFSKKDTSSSSRSPRADI